MADLAFERIVVGVDLAATRELDDGSLLALEQVRWLARDAAAHVTVVHSTHADERWHDGEGNYVFFRDGETLESRPGLDEAVEKLRSEGIDAELVLPEEAAALAITRRVLEEHADLVVVGKRTSAQRRGPLLGSVSAALLHECPSAVWVVKPGGHTAPRTILAATDLSAVGESVVRVAARVASRSGASLHAVHSIQLSMEAQMGGDDAKIRYLAEQRAAATAAIQSALGDMRKTAEIHVGLSSPTRAVLEGVERLHPDLVVMGTVSRGGVAGLLIGNTAERLLGRLDCSLLVLKPEDFVCPVAVA